MIATWIAACAVGAAVACGCGWWRVALLLALHAGSYAAYEALSAAGAVG